MPRSVNSAGPHSRGHTLPSSSSLYQTAVIVGELLYRCNAGIHAIKPFLCQLLLKAEV